MPARPPASQVWRPAPLVLSALPASPVVERAVMRATPTVLSAEGSVGETAGIAGLATRSIGDVCFSAFLLKRIHSPESASRTDPALPLR
jgi:hypothetical protein